MRVELTLGICSNRVRLDLSDAEAEMFRKARESDDWEEFLDLVIDDINDGLDWYLDDAREIE